MRTDGDNFNISIDPTTTPTTMQLLTILTSTLVATTAATAILQPAKRQDSAQRTPPSKYYGISLNINLKPLSQQPVYGRAPVELNMLAQYTVNATEITFDQGVHVNLDLSKVFCQAYSDEDGVQPLGGPFKAPERLVICDVPVPLGSVLCYVGGERVKKD